MNIFDSYKLDIEIIPGILEKEWSEIEKKINLVKPFAHTIHIDLLDGKFAPNTTWMDPSLFAKYTNDINFELHMMVEDPLQYLKPFANAGFHRFIGQVEKMPDVAAFVAEAEDIGEVGLAVDAPTDTKMLENYLEDIDVAFLMTVKAGFSRQQFDESIIKKIQAIRALDGLIPIEVDGGINPETLKQSQAAGATRFVSTGFLFDGSSCQTQYQLLQKASGLFESA